MKIWYRCKCCEKKNVLVEELKRGEKWSNHDWDDLNDFVNCLQEQVFKLDGGDNLNIDPDEFDDNLIPKHVWNPRIEDGHPVIDHAGNVVKDPEPLDKPKDNWPKEFILKWIPEKSEPAKEWQKWVKEMLKLNVDLDKFYEMMKKPRPKEQPADITYKYTFTAGEQGSIIIDPEKSDKYQGNEVNKIDFEEEPSEFLNFMDIIEEGKEYILTYKKPEQLKYEFVKEQIISDVLVPAKRILWVKELEGEIGSWQITLKSRYKPKEPKPIQEGNTIIKCKLIRDWASSSFDTSLSVSDVVFDGKEIRLIDIEKVEELKKYQTILKQDQKIEIECKKGNILVIKNEPDEEDNDLGGDVIETYYYLTISGDFTIRPVEEVNQSGLSFICEVALQWNYGGIIVENFLYENKEISIVEFEDDEKVGKYKEFLKPQQKIEVNFKGDVDFSVDIDDYDDSETTTLIINGEFEIKPVGEEPRPELIDPAQIPLIENVRNDEHAYFDPPPTIHTEPAIKFPSATDAIKDIQTITFTPTGYGEKTDNWLLETKAFKFGTSNYITRVLIPQSEPANELIDNFKSDRQWELKGWLIKEETSKLTFGELNYMVVKAIGTFDEFFDGRWGKEHNKRWPDQLRYEIKEWKWDGLQALDDKETEKFKGTPIMAGKIVVKNFPKLKKMRMNPYHISNGGELVKEIIIENVPKLEVLDLSQTENLKKLVIGEKKKLTRLDVRWTDIKELDLSQTSILKGDYDTPKLPVRDEGDGSKGNIIFPFTQFKREFNNQYIFYKNLEDLEAKKLYDYVLLVRWPKEGERKTLYDWRQAKKLSDKEWYHATHSLYCGKNKNVLLLLEEAKKIIEESFFDVEEGELTLKPSTTDDKPKNSLTELERETKELMERVLNISMTDDEWRNMSDEDKQRIINL